jgi:hypothetical protein
MAEDLEPLRPLSIEEEEIFARHRESATTVQNRCGHCGAWYETHKQNAPFQETFTCDCGERMSFPVSALDTARPLSNVEILDALDPDQKLDTGMKAKEAIARARAWWERKGRALMVSEARRQAEAPGGAANGQGEAFASRDPDDDRFMPSGVLHGEAWEFLDRRSKLMVIKVHHHFTVRKPDLIGGEDDVHKIQDRNSIN